MVLSESVYAHTDIPRFSFARRDGWAVRSSDPSCRRHTVSNAFENGSEPPVLNAGEAIWVNTGCSLPAGADAVISSMNALDKSAYQSQTSPGENIQQVGSDWKMGDKILEKGTRLGARELALLFEADVEKVSGFVKPVIGVLSTGSEIAGVGAQKGFFQKRSSNAVYLTALLKRIGVEDVRQQCVIDHEGAIAEAVRGLSQDCDVVVTIGGTGRGRCDFTRAAVQRAGGTLFEQPLLAENAPPFVLGRVGRSALVGLPGNPLGAIAIAQCVLMDLIRNAFYLPETPQQCISAKMASAIEAGGRGDLCVSLSQQGEGLVVHPIPKAIGRSRIFELADGTVRLDGDGLSVGEFVTVKRFAN